MGVIVSFFVGLIIGGSVGMFAAAMAAASSQHDNAEDSIFEKGEDSDGKDE